VGSQFNAALKGDGIVYTWGRNSNGQCGVNHTFPVFSPNSLNVSGDYYTFSDAKISCGVEHMVVAKANGTIWAWGRNDSGQLGDGTTTDRSVPVEIISGGINTWKRAVAGTSHTMAIKNDGTLWGWGNNSFGQLGDITTTSTSSPVQDMSLSTNWRQVICGFNFSSGLKTDGTIWSWGDNSLGQLGIGDTTSKSSAVQISGGGSNWIHIACGPASNTAFYLGENKF
jgi:alpha-tubulin suppressor-like RCC1 family protein